MFLYNSRKRNHHDPWESDKITKWLNQQLESSTLTSHLGQRERERLINFDTTALNNKSVDYHLIRFQDTKTISVQHSTTKVVLKISNE